MLHTFEITTAAGITLSGAEQGDPSGPAVVFLHGYSDSWRSYAPLLAAMPRSIRAIALTMRGHGDSDKPAHGYGVRDFASDVVEAMDSLGVRDATIVGHSMGSLVAQRLALAIPRRVRRLVLIGAFASVKGKSEAEALWRDAVAGLTDPVDPVFVADFQLSTLARPVADAFLQSVIAESRKLPAHVWRAALRAMLNTDDSGDVDRIGAPTLILWGDRDTYANLQEQQRIAAAIPNARLNVLPGTGHSPHWEDPAGIATDIVAFIGLAARKAA